MLAAVGKDNIVINVILFLGLFAMLGFGIYWTKKENRPTFNLVLKSLLFALIGFTTYAMIIIRSNQDTPINLNSPKTFSSLVSYLNREQYGDNPIFKRRYSSEPQHRAIYTEYDNDLEFFLDYQMDHMVKQIHSLELRRSFIYSSGSGCRLDSTNGYSIVLRIVWSFLSF